MLFERKTAEGAVLDRRYEKCKGTLGVDHDEETHWIR